MIEERRSSPPHAVIIAAVTVAVMVLPTLIGDQCDAVTESVAELLSPLGLLLLPITLLLAIQFLSSSSDARIFSSAHPNSVHRLGGSAGSTTGVVVFLLLVLLLLYTKLSTFSDDDDDSV